MKLRAYEQLGLSRSAVIKLVSCSPQLLVGEVNNVFADVLERMRVIGFDSNWILVHLSSRETYNWNGILYTLCILCELGFSDAEMEALFREDAALLLARCGKQVYVVAGSLLKLGLKMKEVLALVSKYRKILSPEGAKNFSKALYMLYEVGTKPESIVQILSTHMEYLVSQSLKGPRTVLKEFNGDRNSLRQALEKDPSAFFNLAFKKKKCDSACVAARNLNNIVAKTDFLLRLGYIENSDEMVKAFKLFQGRGDQLQERFDCLVDGGLDFHMVSSMVKQAPAILNQKKEILEEKIDFLKNYLGYLPVESIRGFPSYLGCGMERIRVRFSMYAWLREKGCVEPMKSVSTLVVLSDTGFVKYYVDLHPNGPAMWQHLKKSLLNG